MADEKPPIEPEDAFDAFLRRHFAEIRSALDRQIAAQPPRWERPLKVQPPARRKAYWLASLAAMLLVAVAIPLLWELDYEQELQKSEPPPAELAPDTTPPEEPVPETTGPTGAAPVEQPPRQVKPASKSKEMKPKAAERTDSPASAKAPAATPSEPEIKTRAPAESPGAAEPARDEVSREKEELERLWQEYQRDPVNFRKDTRRMARLRLLLLRYDKSGRKLE
ncbi:MAG: hypothetical protein N2Z22_03655 [Turneriella sp.]|nr:hypothetical protein [Turneriella sp.]